MHIPYILIITLTTLSPCIALDPWYFTWTDPSNKTHSESASAPDNTCFKIDNPIGKYFDWTAGDGWCIDFWENSNCSGSADAGHTCKPWPWRAVAEHHHLRSFRAVVNGSDPSGSGSGSGASATDSAGDSSASDGSLSGGAIAGIVIGVVAGVAILAVAAWFFFYRRRQRSNPTEPDPLDAAAADEKETGTHSPVVTTLAELPHAPVDKPSELMGDHNMRVEMSDTQRVAELDGTGINQRELHALGVDPGFHGLENLVWDEEANTIYIVNFEHTRPIALESTVYASWGLPKPRKDVKEEKSKSEEI